MFRHIQTMVDVLATGVNILELPFCREKTENMREGQKSGFMSDSTTFHTRSRFFQFVHNI